MLARGEVAEWSMAALLKSAGRRAPWVRIPPSPPAVVPEVEQPVAAIQPWRMPALWTP